MRHRREEEALHLQIAEYLKWKYPNVIFLTEPSGIRVSIGLAIKLKRLRSKHKHLDLYILHPKVTDDKIYHGLVLELKANPIYKKRGSGVVKKQHYIDQQATIDLLNSIGYYAAFACSFKEATEIIDNYLSQ